MLGVGDRLIFTNQRCVFKTSRGQVIELSGAISCTKPGALISHEVAELLADQLQTFLKCSIEVLRATDGFEFMFRSPPEQACLESPGAYRITISMLDAFYKSSHAGEERPSILLDISKHLNKEGAEAIRWFLQRIHLHPHASKTDLFRVQFNRVEASWTPPERLPGYKPLRGNPDENVRTPATKKSPPALSSRSSKK